MACGAVVFYSYPSAAYICGTYWCSRHCGKCGVLRGRTSSLVKKREQKVRRPREASLTSGQFSQKVFQGGRHSGLGEIKKALVAISVLVISMWLLPVVIVFYSCPFTWLVTKCLCPSDISTMCGILAVVDTIFNFEFLMLHPESVHFCSVRSNLFRYSVWRIPLCTSRSVNLGYNEKTWIVSLWGLLINYMTHYLVAEVLEAWQWWNY